MEGDVTIISVGKVGVVGVVVGIVVIPIFLSFFLTPPRSYSKIN